MDITITKKDVKDAHLVYQWLFFAPILAVPCWAFSGLSNSRNLLVTIFAAMLPLIFYAPVFIWAFAPNPYVRAHARQGVVLLALRFCCAVLVGTGSSYMLAGNLVLWLVGSLVGLVQAGNGLTWIGDIRAEVVDNLPIKTRAADGAAPSQEVQVSLNIFRAGTPAAREAAVRRLEALGQVEIF
jgi:hypothetical protein